MKAAVVTFPGSNCDDDTVYALAHAGFQVSSVWHKERASLGDHRLIVLPGGFSYGDYLRCGAMASLSPVMQDVREYAERGGLVLGLCNGFQILCESGLLPGALTRNQSLKFVCKDVHLTTQTVRAPWTGGLARNEVLTLPIAHGDGRYWIDEQGLTSLDSNAQVLFRYTNAKGESTEDANPNGSTSNIAGITNAKGNVFGLMPHPERATDLRSGDGAKFWKSVMRIAEGTQP